MLPSLVSSASSMNDSNGMGMNDPEKMTSNGDMPMTKDKTGEGSMGMQDSMN